MKISLFHSEQSEESEFEMTSLFPKNQILRFAQNDKGNHYPIIVPMMLPIMFPIMFVVFMVVKFRM